MKCEAHELELELELTGSLLTNVTLLTTNFPSNVDIFGLIELQI